MTKLETAIENLERAQELLDQHRARLGAIDPSPEAIQLLAVMENTVQSFRRRVDLLEQDWIAKADARTSRNIGRSATL